MDPSTKRQLVGAAVLVALAVIFLPMIFSGSDEQRSESSDVPVEVPSRPEGSGEAAEEGAGDQGSGDEQQSGQSPAIELPEVDGSPSADDGGSGAAEAPQESGSTGTAPPSSEGAVESPPMPETPEGEGSGGEAAADGSSRDAEETGDAGEADRDEAEGDEAEGDGVSLGEGDYAVQVGSFRKESNARAERDRIRDLGIPAYLEAVEHEGQSMHRVRVGPVMDREKAKALLERVTEEADVEGFVVQR